jgi:nucleotide-binding universal stress UspA family protein
MLRRILVVLGETPSSLAARQYALRLAQGVQVEIAGLAGVDSVYIERRMPGRVGATAYQARLRESLTKQADDTCKRLHEAFESECRTHKLSFEWLSFEGDPVDSLCSAAETRDLVIAGHDTAFRGNVLVQLSEMLSKLLFITPRPMIICPDRLSDADRILVAYDGSVSAMRALQMFALLGASRDRLVQILSVDANHEVAARRTAGAANYLRIHGYQVEESPIASRLHPAKALKSEIGSRKTGTLIMGAYGHRGFQQFLFGSTTGTLIQNPPCALFLYH